MSHPLRAIGAACRQGGKKKKTTQVGIILPFFLSCWYLNSRSFDSHVRDKILIPNRIPLVKAKVIDLFCPYVPQGRSKKMQNGKHRKRTQNYTSNKFWPGLYSWNDQFCNPTTLELQQPPTPSKKKVGCYFPCDRSHRQPIQQAGWQMRMEPPIQACVHVILTEFGAGSKVTRLLHPGRKSRTACRRAVELSSPQAFAPQQKRLGSASTWRTAALPCGHWGGSKRTLRTVIESSPHPLLVARPVQAVFEGAGFQ